MLVHQRVKWMIYLGAPWCPYFRTPPYGMICRHSCTWYAITFKVFGKLGTSLVYFQRKRPIFIYFCDLFSST